MRGDNATRARHLFDVTRTDHLAVLSSTRNRVVGIIDDSTAGCDLDGEGGGEVGEQISERSEILLGSISIVAGPLREIVCWKR